jgi:hypothetical protein
VNGDVCTELPCSQVQTNDGPPDVAPPALTLAAWALTLDYGTVYPEVDISPCATSAATAGCWAWATDAVDGDVSSTIQLREVSGTHT